MVWLEDVLECECCFSVDVVYELCIFIVSSLINVEMVIGSYDCVGIDLVLG